MLWPVAVFWIVALALLRGPPVRLLYATLAAMPFGAFDVSAGAFDDVLGLAPGGWPGLAPAPVFAVLLVARTLATGEGATWFGRAWRSHAALVGLLAFCGFAIVATAVSPGAPARAVPLGHLVLSGLVVLAAARMLVQEDARRHLLNAVLVGAVLTALTGMLDPLFSAPFAPEVFAPLRTMADTVGAATWRSRTGERPLAGLMPDPVAFGTLCLMFAATAWFQRSALRHAWLRAVAVPWLCLLLALLAWLSLAPAVRVGIVSIALVAALRAAWRAVRPRIRLGQRRYRPLDAPLAVAACLTVLLALAAIGPVHERAGRLVGGTVTLESVQRMRGEPVGHGVDVSRVVSDTRGLGLGVGNAVDTNPLAALLTSVGVPGTLCLAAFLALAWSRRVAPRRVEADRRSMPWLSAWRWSLPCVALTWFAGHPGADPGPFLALLLGAGIGAQQGPRTRDSSLDVEERDEFPRMAGAGVAPFRVEPVALVDLGDPGRPWGPGDPGAADSPGRSGADRRHEPRRASASRRGTERGRGAAVN